MTLRTAQIGSGDMQVTSSSCGGRHDGLGRRCHESSFGSGERAFVDEYVVSGNAAASAVKAGYSKAAARQTGHKLLGRRRVQEELARRAQQ